mmetsp:Transcript_31328/g.71174  ORF Transcript_31328/g.71174 Transcript_31328/m.71174 type:complete len:216 (+) Transcript_31328:90-737(+)
MDFMGLKQHAVALEAVTEKLQEDSKEAPSVLVKPAFDRVQEITAEVYAMINEAVGASSSAGESQKRDIKDAEEEVSELLQQLSAELAEDPWHNPPVLRRMRQTTEALSKKVSSLHEQRRKVVLGRQAPQGRVVAGMAQGGDKVAKRDQQMNIEEALGMLVDKKDTVWQGGLIGIVHAAGVQEMTPITAHSPGRFEFLFAPKSQAAWNLHTFSTMM